ncbi:homeobox protein BEL1-like protein [Iris pallida]|uniref:Homeobox protein BEL1-like protein n=1 Tax=Iris pallida TaxID=29817 RepID=A0AAX6DZS9_IRIPA|nr:homeobox protein BEL1-like protein [Iris pallida]KAJ6802973.1 homeobox protein BEL1-like protein [Iris pallida]
MDFSSGAAGSHMVMQAYDERSAELFGLQHANPNPSWLQGGGAADGGNGFSIRPSQEELSLSLAKPSDTIGFHLSGTASSSSHHHQQEQLFMQDIGSERFYQSQQQQQSYQLKSSKYLFPAQELLNEFCSLGGGNTNTNRGVSPKTKDSKAASNRWEEGGPSSLYSMDLADLQKRKAKLLAMLEEVYKRYRRYCEQMRAVVSAFEATAGEGSARVYSTLASKAMSRHFRCLRDGIKGQIQAMRAVMGETYAIAPGTTRGETPRLKKLEQCLRQQKAYQQAGVMESQPWRPQRGLPERSVSVLRAWLFEHFLHPYPSDVDKHILARQTGLSRSQVSNWFINARVRLWKPMVEEMYMEEVKDEENPNGSSSHPPAEDQKPGPEQLLNDFSGSLSSIINSRHPASNLNPNLNFGVIGNMDFAPSLTLGPHDVGQAGMSLSFSPASQHPLLFSREHNLMDDGQQVHQYSILDEEGQNLPYRNLMGAHLLHDLAG